MPSEVEAEPTTAIVRRGEDGWGGAAAGPAKPHRFDRATDSFFATRLAMTAPSLLTVALATGTLVGCRSASVAAVEPAQQPETAFVAGELIVKLRPEAGRQLDEALAAGALPRHTGLAWFDQLNERYGVTKVEPLFTYQADTEDIKRKFPERTKRAPPGAEVPTLRYVYTLTMSRDANVLQAASDYTAQPDVEYAEPNYIATIQESANSPTDRAR